MNIMPPWISHIISAQRKESNKNSSRWIQLASIGCDNTPRVRTVVFRGWSESYEMEIYTDKRSQKYFELNMNDNVEVCWLFSKAKCQFRFRGTTRIATVEENLIHWNQLNEKTKSMWNWPRPGDQYNLNQSTDLSINSNVDSLNNFTLLKIYITEVDQLLLHKPIHTRRRWKLKSEWIENRINP
tara:strand:+ start:327 stop:878 length:552 start_codon:yes stop_codon:yes gene_type:complete